MKLVINLVTRGRPALAKKTILKTLPNITNPETVFLVSVDDDDLATIEILKDQPGITLSIKPREDSVGEKTNRALDIPADLYTFMADYAPHLTYGFDQKILDANTFPDGIGVIYSHLANASFPALQVVTRKLADLMGGFYPTYFPYWFVDHWLDDIAKMINRIAFVDISIDISNKQTTQELRDLDFWTRFYDAKAPEREDIASKIIEAMNEPTWKKIQLIEAFPLIRERSLCLNSIVRQTFAGIITTIPDARYQRIIANAKTLLPEVKQDTPVEKPTLFIFIPSYKPCEPNTLMTVQRLLGKLNAVGIKGGISTAGLALISELRNVILTIFYDKTDASHLLFIDSDMGFQPELILDMLEFNEPLVGAMYPQRTFPLTWAGSSVEGNEEQRGEFIELEGVGMGVTLIRRDVVKTLLEKMPQLSDTRIHKHPAEHYLVNAGVSRIIRAFDNIDIPDRGIVHEDLAFCLRWRQCGGRVWANMGHRISHIGPHDFGARFLDHLPKAA